MDQVEVDMQAFVVVLVDIRLVTKEGNLTYLSCNLNSFHQGAASSSWDSPIVSCSIVERPRFKITVPVSVLANGF